MDKQPIVHISKLYSNGIYKSYCSLTIKEEIDKWSYHKKPESVTTSHKEATCLDCLSLYLDKKKKEINQIEDKIKNLS